MEFLVGGRVVAGLFVGVVFECGFAPCAVDVFLGGFEGDAEEGVEVGVGGGVILYIV